MLKPRRVRKIKWLYRLFDRVNAKYFDGKLPLLRIKISKNEINCCGAFLWDSWVDKNKCRIIFNGELVKVATDGKLEETMKHEMAHYEFYLKDKNCGDGDAIFEKRLSELKCNPIAISSDGACYRF